jgi:hypothetical protein
MRESTPVEESTSVEELTPVETLTSKKRPRSPSTQDEFGLRHSRRARRDANTGLPVLSLIDEATWKKDFPGNTPALLTILLTWSNTIWTLHNRIPDPKLFSTHPSFPYPITPPIAKKLLSVSFYDTSIEPHRELRFLGPGDVAELSYHEVDVFRSHRREEHPQVPLHTAYAAVGVLNAMQASSHSRYTTMAQRARTGEGRWCYVLAKGHAPEDGGTAPHIILAWHISCVTGTSNGFHTIYPDDSVDRGTPTVPAQDTRKLRRRSSMQNLGQLEQTQPSLKKTLRTASSTSALPRFGSEAPVELEGEALAKQDEGVTLQRTVLKMEKAGRIPLVEGYKVDVDAFRGWMEACGTGDGKVILWRE